MPHSFEHAIEDIVLKGETNGGLSTVDVLKALVALNRSTEAKFEQVLHEVSANRDVVVKMFNEHQTNFMHMTQKEFDIWVENYALRRDEAHVRFHNKYIKELEEEQKRRFDDPAGVDMTSIRQDFLERPIVDEEIGDIRRVWRVARWLAVATIPVLIGVIIHDILT